MRYIIATAILIRHGINPFIQVAKIQNKLKSRLSDSEKRYIVDHSNCPEIMREIIF